MNPTRRQWPSWSPDVARKALSGHAVIGLSVGALLYLTCLTGTLSVFREDFRNWEAPFVERIDSLSAVRAEELLHDLMNDSTSSDPSDMIVTFPTPQHPYGLLELFRGSGVERRAIGADGVLTAPLDTPWTDFLEQLHADLNASYVGSLIVGLLGLLLMSAIITGVVAHRKILIDAFAIRRSGSPRLFQADTHNRLGAWALPFHLVIALTGAFLALTPLLVPVAVWYGYAGDTGELADVYNGKFPDVPVDAGRMPDIAGSLAQVSAIDPNRPVAYLVVHDPGTSRQSIDIEMNALPHLAYAEVHRFAGDGTYLGSRHYTDGPPGLQFFAASGSLHFGDFSSLAIRMIYGLLGLALVVTCVTGVNIWFAAATARGRNVALPHRLWRAVVWGVPLALGVAAVASIACNEPRLVATFWASFGLILALSLVRSDAGFVDRTLRAGLALTLVVTASVFTVSSEHSPLTPQSLVVSLTLLLAAIVLVVSLPAFRVLAGRMAGSATRRA